jgi:hypothetical protein
VREYRLIGEWRRTVVSAHSPAATFLSAPVAAALRRTAPGPEFLANIHGEVSAIVAWPLLWNAAEGTTMDLEAPLNRLRGEFLEMPGLRLTPAQAARLSGLDPAVCHRVIEGLLASRFLRWTPGGQLARADR